MQRVLERWIRRCRGMTPITADSILAIVLAALSVGMLFGSTERPQGPVTVHAVLLTLLATLPLVARRRRPFLVLAVVELAEALYLLTATVNPAPSGLGLAFALYTVATIANRRTSLRIAGAIAGINVAIMLVASLELNWSGSGPALFALTAVVVGSWALGDNARTRRAYLAQLEERARRLESDREENARLAVRDERSRIARELHDVIAHHVSAIAVQAGAAEEIAERNPNRARETLHAIQEISRQALSEMRSMLNVLHSGDEVGQAREPQPGLAQVERLVGQSQAAGLRVSLSVEGAVRPLPEALDLSAYRIVQEALTNSLKHAGPAHASVLVRYADQALELEVNDDGSGPPSHCGTTHQGRGLIGMRERVALFGGDLDAGPTPGRGFHVLAHLPVRQP